MIEKYFLSNYKLPAKEYSKIVHEINTLYYSRYSNQKFGVYRTLDLKGNYCIYYFEIIGFDNYNICMKLF